MIIIRYNSIMLNKERQGKLIEKTNESQNFKIEKMNFLLKGLFKTVAVEFRN